MWIKKKQTTAPHSDSGKKARRAQLCVQSSCWWTTLLSLLLSINLLHYPVKQKLQVMYLGPKRQPTTDFYDA